ncbi:MAG: nucleotidyl transferase AbiEii/AbiGii toxin family protein [Candidatus Pacearchaeota archaeon]
MVPKIPWVLKLKKSMHKEVARAQDIVIEELYKIFDKAVLHGGTAIWRCYKGNRFSEDIDVYIPKNLEKVEEFFKNLKKRGFIIQKKKITENSIYSVLELNKTIIRFEALFKNVKGELKEYETSDGNLITIYTLNPEEIIKEKINTYLKRKKIRDLYDIFFLLRFIEEKTKIKEKLKKLIKNFEKPIDEKELKILIIEGLVPSVEKMLDYIERF